MARFLCVLVLLGCWGMVSASVVRAADAPNVEKYLEDGKLQQGIADLEKYLAQNPQDNRTQFGLGVMQFLRAIERMIHSFQQMGLQSAPMEMPFLRLRVPAEINPKPVSYAALRDVYDTLRKDLETAEHTLSLVKGDVKLPLRVGRIRLDFNGDGTSDADESFWKLYTQLNREANVTPEVAEAYTIAFDTADVLWLRGYCHLLLALDEFILAHNWKDAFDSCAHLFFRKVDSPYKYLQDDVASLTGGNNFFGPEHKIADAIAFIHLIRFPVADPARMKSSLSHLEAMLDLSRQTWKAIAAETDDDNEWLPGPKQTGVIPGVKVTVEIVNGWHDFLDEAEALLQGKKLVPHWRVTGRAVNLRRVFLKPTQFDVVLWIQGTAAAPYLEQGETTKADTWNRLQRIFQGQFIGFALWFN